MEVERSLNDNTILIAGGIGAISTAVSDIASWILLFLGFGKYSVYQLNSLIVTINKPSEVMGLIVNFLVGSILSVLIYFTLKKWGSRYTVITCITASLIMWLLWEVIFTLAIEGKFIDIRPASSYYNHLISSLLFGISMGLMQKRFIFNKI